MQSDAKNVSSSCNTLKRADSDEGEQMVEKVRLKTFCCDTKTIKGSKRAPSCQTLLEILPLLKLPGNFLATVCC